MTITAGGKQIDKRTIRRVVLTEKPKIYYRDRKGKAVYVACTAEEARQAFFIMLGEWK